MQSALFAALLGLACVAHAAARADGTRADGAQEGDVDGSEGDTFRGIVDRKVIDEDIIDRDIIDREMIDEETSDLDSLGGERQEKNLYYGSKNDPCRQVCNEYADICLPTWLDPWDFFVPHCEDVRDVGRPGVSCLLCLKTHGITPSSKRPTKPSKPVTTTWRPQPTTTRRPQPPAPPIPTTSRWPSTSTTTTTTTRRPPSVEIEPFEPTDYQTEPTEEPGYPEYTEYPEYTNNHFQPETTPSENLNPPFTTKYPPFVTNPTNPTFEPFETEEPTPPNSHYPTSWTVPETERPDYNFGTSVAPRPFTPSEPCPQICTCTRVQTVTTEVTTSYCPLTYDADYACDLNDPGAVMTAADESHCTCEEDPSCNGKPDGFDEPFDWQPKKH